MASLCKILICQNWLVFYYHSYYRFTLSLTIYWWKETVNFDGRSIESPDCSWIPSLLHCLIAVFDGMINSLLSLLTLMTTFSCYYSNYVDYWQKDVRYSFTKELYFIIFCLKSTKPYSYLWEEMPTKIHYPWSYYTSQPHFSLVDFSVN